MTSPPQRQPYLDDLTEVERAAVSSIGDLPVDLEATAVVSNLYRAATVIRRHMAQTVLTDAELSWTAFVTLWVLWLWGEVETRHLAMDVNVTKGSLTGVLDTLERRGYVTRERRTDDRRLVVVRLTPEGHALIRGVFPRFNKQEQHIAAVLTDDERAALTSGLRRIPRVHAYLERPTVTLCLLAAHEAHVANATPRTSRLTAVCSAWQRRR